MMTMIDMASGELISSNSTIQTKHPATAYRDEFFTPSLALQEIEPEVSLNNMPPELADIPAAAILARFE